jgi:hypothetical protein
MVLQQVCCGVEQQPVCVSVLECRALGLGLRLCLQVGVKGVGMDVCLVLLGGVWCARLAGVWVEC